MPLALFEELDLDEEKPRRAPLRGAIGLIELGNRTARPPMIQNRPAPRKAVMGDVLGDAGNFLFDLVGTGMVKIADILAGIIKVPLDFISSGVGLLLTSFAGIVSAIPIIGDFAATLILAANALVQFVLDVPELLIAQVANLGKAFQTLPKSAKDAAVAAAVKLIVGGAPPAMQPQVQAAIEKAPSPAGGTVGGDNLVEWATAASAAVATVAAFVFIR